MNHHIAGRIRGRRVALLLASALPLLAVDDVVLQEPQPQHYHHHHHAPLHHLETATAARDNNNNNAEAEAALIAVKRDEQEALSSFGHNDDRRKVDENGDDETDCASDNSDFDCRLSTSQRLVVEDETSSLTSSLPPLLPPSSMDDDFWDLHDSSVRGDNDNTDDDETSAAVCYQSSGGVVPFCPSFFDFPPGGEIISKSLTTCKQQQHVVSNASSSSSSHEKNKNAAAAAATSTKSSRSNTKQTNRLDDDDDDVSEAPDLLVQEEEAERTSEQVVETTIGAGEDADSAPSEKEQQQQQAAAEEERVIVDYASKSAGALILEKSRGWKGVSNLLDGDKDKYAMIPIAQTNKSIVIGLSEDILLEELVLANYERYSSHPKDFVLLGSQTMVSWVDLGTYTAKPGNGKQRFDLIEPTWARYLKIRFLSHYGEEHYLTVSQVSLHGRTMLQGFHEEWENESEEQAEDGADARAQEEDSTASASTTSVETQPIVHGAIGSINAVLVNDKVIMTRPVNHPVLRNDLCWAKLQEDCTGSLSFETKLRLFSSLDEAELEAFSAVYLTSNSGRRIATLAATTTITTPAMDVILEIPRTTKPFVAEQARRSFSNLLMISMADKEASISAMSGLTMTSTPSRSIQRIQTALLQADLNVDIPTIRKLQEEQPVETIIATEAGGATTAGQVQMVEEKAQMETVQDPVLVEVKAEVDSVLAASSAASIATEDTQDDDSAVATKAAAATTLEGPPTPALPGQGHSSEATTITTVVSSRSVTEDSGGDSTNPSEASGTTTTSSSTGSTATDDTTAATATTYNDDTVDDTLQGTSLALAKTLQRFPSATCLEKLDFAQFKSSVLHARSQRPQHGGSSNGNPGAGMEPIFKKLTDEIRTLQTSLSVHDQFAQESVACYQRVLLDLLMEQEVLRQGEEARLSKLEADMHDYLGWLIAIFRFLSPITSLWSVALGFLVTSFSVTLPSAVGSLVQHISSMLSGLMAMIMSLHCRTLELNFSLHRQGFIELLGAVGGVSAFLIVILTCVCTAGPARRLAASTADGGAEKKGTTESHSVPGSMEAPPTPQPSTPPPTTTQPKQQPSPPTPPPTTSNKQKKKKKQHQAANKQNIKAFASKPTNGMHSQ